MSPMPRSQNAVKHAGYSNLGILPGEDPNEFERLLRDLIAEYAPSGPTERDVVLNLAKYLWRKSRLAIYARAEKARKFWEPVFGTSAPTSNVDTNLLIFAAEQAIRTQQVVQTASDTYEARSQLKADLAQSNEQMVAYWKKKGIDPYRGVSEEMIEYHLAELGTLVTEEMLIKEIELDARLDARIDRLLKRLFQLKAAKQMAGLGQDGASLPAHGQSAQVLLEK